MKPTGHKNEKQGKRILCVCEGGCVRSVALAYLLKYSAYRHNAIAIGIDHTRIEEWRPLLKWADSVVVVSPYVEAKVRGILREIGEIKSANYIHCQPILVDIGEDRWGLMQGPYNAELLGLAEGLLSEKGLI